MYESHFQFEQPPFSIAPDPAFLYLSENHKEALAHLTYGFSHGGFVLITGEVGTGKTTLLRNLIKQTPDDLDVAFILNPRLTVRELLETLCDELGVDYPKGQSLSVKQYIDVLSRHLLETHKAGRDTVVIIDEAQNLSPSVLEQIRLLTNLETDKRKLLRIILIGQPELADLLARTELRQLAQRITARYHLKGLSREDTTAYVMHRLARAGGNPNLFTTMALRRLYRISRGIPRVINLVADRALLGAYVEGSHKVTASLVNRAAAEVLGRERRIGRWIAAGVIAATATGVASAYLLLPGQRTAPTADVEATSTAGAASSRKPVPAPGMSSPGGTPAAAEETASAATTSPVGAAAPVGAASGRELGSSNPEGVLPARDFPADTAPVVSAPELPAPNLTEPDSDQPPLLTAPLSRPAMPAFRTQRLAYQEVFSRWGAPMEGWAPGMIPCNFAPSVGLQCLAQTGSWSDIRRLNLPVVLELWDQSPSPYYAAVTRISEAGIVLRVGDERYTVTPAHLQDSWFGSFVVLWQMPPDYQGTLKRGDRHPSVRWLRRQLDTLGLAPPAQEDAALFDASLQEAVMEFQRREQLLADGIVGPATWIRLSERLELPAPHLDG